jgi:predicted DNA-binding protein (UPF0251 family)
MPRPLKCRRVESVPDITYFKPAGVPMRVLDEVTLSVEEAEAIRLKDLECLEQEDGAGRMNVSRATFQRILASARQKMADALLHGKAIKIAGGDFEMAWHRFRCRNGHEWQVSSEAAASRTSEVCPTCNTPGIEPYLAAGHGRAGESRERRRGRHII